MCPGPSTNSLALPLTDLIYPLNAITMRISKNFFLSILSIGFLLFSCSEQETPVDSTTTQPEPAAADQIDPVPAQNVIPDNPTTTVTDPNPAHGEPGHRCEIPVGASLSTAPPPGAGNATSPVINTSPVIDGPAASEVVTEPGMNPPHGQPGHDCAVAVGAPLPQ